MNRLRRLLDRVELTSVRARSSSSTTAATATPRRSPTSHCSRSSPLGLLLVGAFGLVFDDDEVRERVVNTVEATNAALAVGDFDVGNAQHHGRPEERRSALLVGYRGGEPSACARYLPR